MTKGHSLLTTSGPAYVAVLYRHSLHRKLATPWPCSTSPQMADPHHMRYYTMSAIHKTQLKILQDGETYIPTTLMASVTAFVQASEQ